MAAAHPLPFDDHDDELFGSELWGLVDEATLGGAARYLAHQGRETAAALLLDVTGTSELVTHRDEVAYQRWEDVMYVFLLVPGELAARFTDDVREQITEALRQCLRWQQVWVAEVEVCPSPAPASWREELSSMLTGGPVNALTGTNWPAEDRLLFRSADELAVYRALKVVLSDMSTDDRATVMVNPRARISGHTREPDFVIAYRGRIGILEVDGPHHRGRAAADRSRDRLFEDHGIAYIDRITVEDTNDTAALIEFVRRFLVRLGG